ncbi:MAG: hypothetical protein ABII26_12480 [Pseudomonadota bacterium]
MQIIGKQIWEQAGEAEYPYKEIEAILGSVIRLPVKYWKPRMLFFGAEDRELLDLTSGRFPAGQVTKKKRPVFSIESLPQRSGFRVCPCSSQIPYRKKKYRYIEKDCQLMHTGHVTDRKSYLIEEVSFNIPPSVASRLRFYGEVPKECLKSGKGKG